MNELPAKYCHIGRKAGILALCSHSRKRNNTRLLVKRPIDIGMVITT